MMGGSTLRASAALLAGIPCLYLSGRCHAWTTVAWCAPRLLHLLPEHVSSLRRSSSCCFLDTPDRKVRNSSTGTRVAQAAGEEPASFSSRSPFEEWKSYFLRNNLANPSTASTSWKMREEPVRKGRKAQAKNDIDSVSDDATAPQNDRSRSSSTMMEGSGTSKRSLEGDSGSAGVTNGLHDTTSAATTTESPKSMSASDGSAIDSSSLLPRENDGSLSADKTTGRISSAVGLMSARGEGDYSSSLRAFSLVEEELLALESDATSSTPSTSRLEVTKLAASAKLSWIRSSTEGNQMKLAKKGGATTNDTPEFRRVWKVHAPEVLELIEKTGEDPAQDPELQQMLTETIMYSLSSKGVLQAFASGDTTAYDSAVKVMMEKFPRHDNGVAHIFQGAYFLAAPWPIKNIKKAAACFERALEVNGRSRRNLFYAGLGRLQLGDRKGATEAFRCASSDELSEFASPVERDIAVPIRREVQKGLEFTTRSG